MQVEMQSKYEKLTEVLKNEDDAKKQSAKMLYDCHKSKSYRQAGFKTWVSFLDSLQIEKRNANFKIQIVDWIEGIPGAKDWLDLMSWPCILCLARVMNKDNAQYFMDNITNASYFVVKAFCDEYQDKIKTE